MTVVFHIDGFLFPRLDLPLVKALTPPPPPWIKGTGQQKESLEACILILHTLLEESRLQVL